MKGAGANDSGSGPLRVTVAAAAPADPLPPDGRNPRELRRQVLHAVVDISCAPLFSVSMMDA